VVAFDGTSGLMKNITNLDKQITVNVKQSLLYYRSYPKVEKDYPPSGAYIFRPANSTVYPLSDKVQISVVQVNYFIIFFVMAVLQSLFLIVIVLW